MEAVFENEFCNRRSTYHSSSYRIESRTSKNSQKTIWGRVLVVAAVICAYNHVLLEKTLRLYQICCLTRRKTAAILRIYLEHALFHRLSHSWQQITCTNRIWPDPGGVRTTIAKHHGRYSKSDHLCQDGVEWTSRPRSEYSLITLEI